MMPKTQPINSSLDYVGGTGHEESDPLLDTKSSLEGEDVTVNGRSSLLVDASHKFGLGKASFNIITIVMGAGVLNLPKAVGDTGWLGILLLVLMGVVSGYTSVILAKCMYQEKMAGEAEYPTYTDVGERAFGAFGKWFVSFQVHLTLVGVATIFLILCAQFLVDIVELAGGTLSITHASLIIAAFLWFHVWFDNLSQLGNFSFLSVVATLLLVIVVVVDVFRNIPEDRGTHELIKIQPEFWSSFVAFAFSFGAHPVLPSVVRDMKEPHKYPMLSSVTFLIITLSYLPITIVGYWAFGDNVRSPILDNVKDSALKTSSIVFLLINLLISYAVCLNPSEQALEKQLEKPLKLQDPPVIVSKLKKVALRTVFVGVTLGVAVAIPDFPLVLDLVASLTNTFTVFVLPCAFYSKIFYRELWWPIHVFNLIIILIGFVACGFGTTNAIRNLIS